MIKPLVNIAKQNGINKNLLFFIYKKQFVKILFYFVKYSFKPSVDINTDINNQITIFLSTDIDYNKYVYR